MLSCENGVVIIRASILGLSPSMKYSLTTDTAPRLDGSDPTVALKNTGITFIPWASSSRMRASMCL